MFLYVWKYLEVLENMSKMVRNTWKCLKILENIFKYLKMFNNNI